MGSATNRAIMNEHTRRYIEEIWAERLRAEGFTCPDDKILCWYRVVNHEICQYIVFYATSVYLPVWLNVGYGSCPLFEQPPYLRSVCLSDYPALPGCSKGGMIRESKNDWCLTSFSCEILVYVDANGGKGVNMIDQEILPLLNASQTLEGCLETRKRAITGTDDSVGTMYSNFITDGHAELAILLKDEGMYPEYIKDANTLIDRYGDAERWKKKPHIQKMLKRWQYIKSVLEEDKRDEFLLHLEQRKQKTMKWLEKMGIPF